MAAASSASSAEGPSARDFLAGAADGYASSVILSESAQKQVEAAEKLTSQALARIDQIRQTTRATSEDVDGIGSVIVPQLQKHTEQLTNVFALIDKMSEHMTKVRHSVAMMDKRLEAAEASNAGQLKKTFSKLIGQKEPEMPLEPVHIVSVDEFFASLKV